MTAEYQSRGEQVNRGMASVVFCRACHGCSRETLLSIPIVQFEVRMTHTLMVLAVIASHHLPVFPFAKREVKSDTQQRGRRNGAGNKKRMLSMRLELMAFALHDMSVRRY